MSQSISLNILMRTYGKMKEVNAYHLQLHLLQQKLLKNMSVTENMNLHSGMKKSNEVVMVIIAQFRKQYS